MCNSQILEANTSNPLDRRLSKQIHHQLQTVLEHLPYSGPGVLMIETHSILSDLSLVTIITKNVHQIVQDKDHLVALDHIPHLPLIHHNLQILQSSLSLYLVHLPLSQIWIQSHQVLDSKSIIHILDPIKPSWILINIECLGKWIEWVWISFSQPKAWQPHPLLLQISIFTLRTIFHIIQPHCIQNLESDLGFRPWDKPFLHRSLNHTLLETSHVEGFIRFGTFAWVLIYSFQSSSSSHRVSFLFLFLFSSSFFRNQSFDDHIYC